MKLSQDGKDLGVLCFNMDHHCQTDFRAYIKHISVKDMQIFPQALDVCLGYIWDKLQANSIRIDLYHYQQTDSDGLFKACKANNLIKEYLIMNKKGFKWKTLINDQTGLRYQIMQMNRPSDLKIL
jgi:hypothetical protein